MNLTDSGAAADAVRELLDDPDPPTALLCGQNRITVGALYALRELGLQDRSRWSASTTSRSGRS